MPVALLGPVLRHVDATSATVWVEVDEPGAVAVDVRLPDGSTRTASSGGAARWRTVTRSGSSLIEP